ncbi:MAG TPA: radical SAM protein [Armatimonadota bacterium]|nr:radical SAM protein [Armatimonadota bacterium]
MRILLLHPPLAYRVPAAWRTESLGLGYVGAVLRNDGHEVEALDAHLQCFRVKRTIREILARDFDCLGITAAQAHKDTLIPIVRAVRKRRKDAVIVAGGYLPTLAADHLLRFLPELDFVVRGEGEPVISDLCGRIERGEDWHDTPGIGYLKDGQPVLNPVPKPVQDLDTLPFPIRDALGQAAMPVSPGISTNRGCYHRCSFCCVQSFFGLSGSRVPRLRSPENTVDEIESVIARTNVKTFNFVDDSFLGPGQKLRERVIRLAEEIEARNLKITFTIQCRADEVDEEVLRLLKEVGLTDVFLGIESGVQRQLDTYNKHVTVEQNRRGIEIVRRSGVRLRSGFIMFDPYVTIPELLQNIQFARETGILEEAKKVPVAFVTPLLLHRGVPLVEQLRADGLLREKGIDVDYVFKDRTVGIILKFLIVLGACSEFVKRMFRRREGDYLRPRMDV